MSTSGSSSAEHGVDVYRFGPKKPTGLVRSAKTGSKRMRMPLAAPGDVGVSTRKDAWPSQVALRADLLVVEIACQSGFWT